MRVRRGSAAVVILVVCVGSRGFADDAPATLPSPLADPVHDEVWAAYHQAFEALASGDTDRARQRLQDVVRAHPTHPAAKRAEKVLLDLPPLAPPAPAPMTPEQALRHESPSRGARAELVLFQTLHGVVAGLELCQVIDCDSARPYAAALMGGGAAGLGLSLLGTRKGVRAGHAEMTDSGVLWGAWSGLAISQIRGDQDDKSVWTTVLVGQGVGLGIGALAWNGPKPTAGQVAMASSAGTWATLLTLFTHGIAEFDASPPILWTSLLIAGDVGILAGAALAYQVPVSRGRVYLVNAGGILGFMAGSVVAAFGKPSAPRIFVPMMAGTLAGLALAVHKTSDWDLPAAAPSFAILPHADGGITAALGGPF